MRHLNQTCSIVISGFQSFNTVLYEHHQLHKHQPQDNDEKSCRGIEPGTFLAVTHDP